MAKIRVSEWYRVVFVIGISLPSRLLSLREKARELPSSHYENKRVKRGKVQNCVMGDTVCHGRHGLGVTYCVRVRVKSVTESILLLAQQNHRINRQCPLRG